MAVSLYRNRVLLKCICLKGRCHNAYPGLVTHFTALKIVMSYRCDLFSYFVWSIYTFFNRAVPTKPIRIQTDKLTKKRKKEKNHGQRLVDKCLHGQQFHSNSCCSTKADNEARESWHQACSFWAPTSLYICNQENCKDWSKTPIW